MTSPSNQMLGNPVIDSQSIDRERSALYSRRRKLVLCGAVLLVATGSAGYWIWFSESGLERGRLAADRHDWGEVRKHLEGYLQRHPDDAPARLLLAEACVKDDAGDPRESVERAIGHLRQIGDGSPLAAQARLQEARLTLLILMKPARAERLLRRSLELEADSYEANLLMWKLLDLTGRHIASRDYFWRVYEMSPNSERGLRLRDWFFSEFFPETANAHFHSVFGAKRGDKIPASINLLAKFRESEPDAVCVHAALAAYYLDTGNRNSSLELLKEAPNLQEAMRDPLYVSVLFETLVDLGELQKAKSCFENWPRPHSGYLYWRAAGIFQQDVLNDPSRAVVNFKKSLSTWPAKFDWKLMMRLSGCLRKIDRSGEAERIRSRVEYLTTRVLTNGYTRRLRKRLGGLSDPSVAAELVNFYREFGLVKEAEAWKNYRQRLLRLTRTSAGASSPVPPQ